MVTIVDYKKHQREYGEAFYTLEVQGGIELVKSKETGRNYFTARSAKVSCTFNEMTCKALIGTQISGSIKKVEVEPYEYVDPQTAETMQLNHRYEYLSEEESIIEQHVLKKEMVY